MSCISVLRQHHNVMRHHPTATSQCHASPSYDIITMSCVTVLRHHHNVIRLRPTTSSWCHVSPSYDIITMSCDTILVQWHHAICFHSRKHVRMMVICLLLATVTNDLLSHHKRTLRNLGTRKAVLLPNFPSSPSTPPHPHSITWHRGSLGGMF